jgi:hypothetical protein
MSEQPPRGPKDGPLEVSWVKEPGDTQAIAIAVVHDGLPQALWLSEYNAWRLFGMLSVILNIDLPKKLRKSIKF